MPKGIIKAVSETLETSPPEAAIPNKPTAISLRSPKAISQEIQRLEKEMHRLAEHLELEKAAHIRDEITAYKNQLIHLS